MLASETGGSLLLLLLTFAHASLLFASRFYRALFVSAVFWLSNRGIFFLLFPLPHISPVSCFVSFPFPSALGLSLPYPTQPLGVSFSGSLSPISKLFVIPVMILGRQRGLPESLDPAIAFHPPSGQPLICSGAPFHSCLLFVLFIFLQTYPSLIALPLLCLLFGPKKERCIQE